MTDTKPSKDKNKLFKNIKKNKVNIKSSLKDVAFEESGYNTLTLYSSIRFKVKSFLFICSFLEKDHDNEIITQHDILNNVDMLSAQKYFELNLDSFGPYRLNYTKNGR